MKFVTKLGVAAILAISVAGLSAAGHAAAKARSRANITAWLKQCDTDDLQCGTRLLKVPFAKTACIPESDLDSEILTPKVRTWLQAHPGHNADPIDKGINAALTDLYPCQH